MRLKYKNLISVIFIITLLLYSLIYIYLRTNHIFIHTGAYYKQNKLFFYDHRIDVDPALFVFFPKLIGITTVFLPAICLEVNIWKIIYPIDPEYLQ